MTAANDKDAELDLSLLPIFQLIFRHRNLTSAAKELGLSQSALSRALGKLRRQLDDPLFELQGRELKPTAYASALAAELPDALARLQSLIATNSATKSAATASANARLRLACDAAAQVWLLQQMGADSSAEATALPQLQLQPPTTQWPKLLANGKLDCALNADAKGGKPRTADPELRCRQVFQDEFVCAVRPGHPAAIQAATSLKALSLEDYLQLRHIGVQWHSGADSVNAALSAMNKKRRLAVKNAHPAAATELALHSDLCLTCPQSIAAQKGLRPLPLPFAAHPWVLCLYWRMDRTEEPALRQWLQFLAALD